ncbi:MULTISPECIES: hypothetical protein [Staphylococcus]|uniref:hypothetical protein n=1 Tax=Staphylococcus TaxID=1279 RepID=UPI0021D0B4F3|nr:hypothetical protein [Staphylococcus sp. IVB6181]UXV35187.1 hypothetical protein MUA90_01185 [Staphylococcus sp. IVB6181]
MKVTYVAIYYKNDPKLEGKYFFIDFDVESLHELMPPIEMLPAEDCLGFALAKYKELGLPLPKAAPIELIFLKDTFYYEKKAITIELNEYAGTKKRKPKKFIPEWLYQFEMSEHEKFCIKREREWQRQAIDELMNTEFEGKHAGFMSGRPWLPRASETLYTDELNLH